MHVLVVGHLDGHLSIACQMALKRQAQILHVTSHSAALESLKSGKGINAVLVDVMMDVGGLIASLGKERISLPVIACGTGNDAKLAAAAIRAGALEYLPLPPDEEMIAAVFQAISEDQYQLLVFDPKMQPVVKMIDRVADSQASVMITGGSGTGKEMVARHIHLRSRRAKEAFVAVNCAAIPENLLESELFGYERGAFTGAVSRRIGRFEEANKGTLLLDEISEMDPRLQSKLLRAIQEKEIDRLGGKKPIAVDVRIVATSNRDMQQAVAEGQFREDLFFRLNVIPLIIPPLKDRPKDIEGLTKHFVKHFAEENGRNGMKVAPETWTMLLSYHWPGNVRELENTVHRAVLMCDGDVITSEHIILTEAKKTSHDESDEELQAKIVASHVGRTVAEVERDLIIDTLGRCLGNRSAAARILGISVRTLRNKLRLYKDEDVTRVQHS